jgi:transcription antitermination factor NusG
MESKFKDLKPGDVVRVKAGPFTSFIGIIERVNTKSWVATIRVDVFGKAVGFEIRVMDVEKVPQYHLEGPLTGLN